MHNFQSRFVMLNAEATSLPFAVGGVTQHGFHMPEGNNQDAMSLWVDEASIIAIVCDGCAGSSPHGVNTVSFNETGAQILSVLAVQTTRHLLDNGLEPGAEMVARMEKDLYAKYVQVVSLLAGNDSYLREHMLFELLMSTLVGAVICPERWCVFHGGDGLVIFNGRVQNLDDYSGQYLANTIVLRQKGNNTEGMLRLFQEGKSVSLNSLLLGTDGLLDLANRPGRPLEELTNRLDQRSTPYKPGYDAVFFREFRKRVWNPLASETSGEGEHDDRSLLLIRRLPKTLTEHLSEQKPKVAFLESEGKIPLITVTTAHPEPFTAEKPAETRSDIFQEQDMNPIHTERTDGEPPRMSSVSLEHDALTALLSTCPPQEKREASYSTAVVEDRSVSSHAQDSSLEPDSETATMEEVGSTQASDAPMENNHDHKSNITNDMISGDRQ